MNRTVSRHAVAVVAAVAVGVMFSPAISAQNQQPAGARNQPVTQGPPSGQTQSEPKVDPNKVVLTVGNEKITAGQCEALIGDLPPQQQQLLRRTGKRMLADELVRIKLFAQEAEKRKLDQNDKVRRQLELTRAQILASALASDTLRKTYEADKQRFEKIRARHILIRTPGSRAPVRPGQKELTDQEAKAKADDLRKQIAGGADFAELARKESDDTVSGAQGGDLDTFGRGAMVPEFDQAAFALKQGEVSQPVKTPFGYHLIEVTDILGFEDVQQDIAAQSNPQIQKLVEELKKSNPVQVDESYFGPAPTAPNGPGTPAQGATGATGAQQPQQPAPPATGQR